MRRTIKFIFVCLTAVMLFTPVFYKDAAAAEEIVEHSVKNIEHGEKNAVGITEEHEAAVTAQREHGSSNIWPHYVKMVVFAEIIFAFMIFSFIAPLVHFYIKGENHH